ncbi:hypothetical protein DSO57_1026319 [Entomophthora muscae]|uniref:Uncharacterized protein n=1 Tax=Entomophthora muscae TaxID=34485 RepID=A0ACC2TEA2_9FUNG|nr:hypothetical protein DSO57_1026319 [Entomophthora muscae]
MGMPKCSLCAKLGRTCTYARDGFSKEKLGIDNQFLLWLASLARKRSQVLVGVGGEYIYFGPSMTTHYLTSNSRLLANVTSTFVADFVAVDYNRQTPVYITRTLVMQLVELYFGYLNNFFPLVDPSSFYSQLNTGKFTFDFQLLFNAVCLTGASYYPHRVLGRLIAIHFSKQLKSMLRKAIFRPSLVAVQACILAAYHISVCDDQDSVASAWFTLGVATSMAALLGVPRIPPNCSSAERQLRLRIRLFLFICDSTLANCFGRPQWVPMQVNPRTVELPTLSFSYAHLFSTCQVTQIRPETTAIFFRDFCRLHAFVGQRILLKETHALMDNPPPPASKTSFVKLPAPTLPPACLSRIRPSAGTPTLPPAPQETLFFSPIPQTCIPQCSRFSSSPF